MKLNELKIELHKWGKNEGKYTGEVTFSDETGAVTMTLDPEVSNLVLAALSDKLLALIKRPAADIAASFQQSIVEAKSAPTLTA